MVTYTNILVPVDGSEHAKLAVENAAVLADKLGAKITLIAVANVVSAVSSFEHIPSTSSYYIEKVVEEMEENARLILDEMKVLIPSNIEVESVFDVGSPGPTILTATNKYNCDFIVMGSRGLGPIKGLFVGSVSSYVVRHASCPVLIIK